MFNNPTLFTLLFILGFSSDVLGDEALRDAALAALYKAESKTVKHQDNFASPIVRNTLDQTNPTPGEIYRRAAVLASNSAGNPDQELHDILKRQIESPLSEIFP